MTDTNVLINAVSSQPIQAQATGFFGNVVNLLGNAVNWLQQQLISWIAGTLNLSVEAVSGIVFLILLLLVLWKLKFLGGSFSKIVLVLIIGLIFLIVLIFLKVF